MIGLAVKTGRQLDTRRADVPLALVFQECILPVALGEFDLARQTDGILDRHIRALREVLQHGMGGVAQQRDIALAPVPDWRAVAQDPHAPALDLAEECAHRRTGLGEALVQFGRIAIGVPAFGKLVGMEYGHEIVELAAAHRILDEMGLLARPDDHRPFAEILGHFARRQNSAIGDVSGDIRLAVTDDLLANGRP